MSSEYFYYHYVGYFSVYFKEKIKGSHCPEQTEMTRHH